MRIPIIQADEPLVVPQTRIRSPYEGAIVEKALGNLGEAGLALGAEIIAQKKRVDEKLKEGEKRVKLADISKNFKVFANKLSGELRFGEKFNPETHYQRYEEAIKQKRNEILSNITEPEMKALVSERIDNISEEFLMHEAKFERTKRAERIIAGYEKQAIDAANAGNLDLVKQVTEEAVRMNYATPEWKQKIDTESESIVENADILNRLYGKNIEQLDALRKDLDGKKYKTINPFERERYKRDIDNEKERIRKEQEAKEDREKSLELVADVSKEFEHLEDEPELFAQARINKLRNPQYLKSKGANLTQGRQAIEFIENEERRVIRAKEKASETIQNDFLDRLQKGILTPGEVIKSTLSFADKGWFLSKINERMKELQKREDDIYLRSNPKTKSEILTGVLTNTGNWNKKKIFSYIGKKDKDGNYIGITPQDAIYILKVYDDLIKPDEAGLTKKYLPLRQAAERLENYRKLGLFIIPEKKGTITPEEMLRNDLEHAAVLQELTTRAERGEDATAVLHDIMKKYVEQRAKQSWYEKLYEATIGKVLEPSLPKSQPEPELRRPSGTKSTPPAERKPIRLSDLKPNDIIEDASGVKAQYEGNGVAVILSGPNKGKRMRVKE